MKRRAHDEKMQNQQKAERTNPSEQELLRSASVVSGCLSLEARYIFSCRPRSRLRNPFMITREVEAQAGVVLRLAPGQDLYFYLKRVLFHS